MRLCRHGLALSPLLLSAGLLNVSAWDKDGHEAIGMTAMSALEGTAAAQVKHLMGGKDAVDVAAWAHKVNKKYPWTVPLHFQPQPSWNCGGSADTSMCGENRCLLKALKHLYGRLTNQNLVTIDWPAGMHLTDADAVKYLINLIGDLHQPMHLSLASEDMGRNLTVVLRGKLMSMFDLWDSGLTQAIMQDSPSFWWGGWTHVQRTRVEYEKDSEKWKRDGVVSFDHWADETNKFLCESIHTNPVTGKPLWKDGKDQPHVDVNLFGIWKREMLSRMLVAGARTAIVLNAILKHREGLPELHVGTAVKDLEGEEEEPKKVHTHGRKGDDHHPIHNAEEGIRAAFMNLGIFFFTGAIFLQLMKMWQGRDAVNAASRAKHTQADGGKKT